VRHGAGAAVMNRMGRDMEGAKNTADTYLVGASPTPRHREETR